MFHIVYTDWNILKYTIDNFIWLVVSTPLKNMKVNGKDDIPYILESKNGWNHQPVMFHIVYSLIITRMPVAWVAWPYPAYPSAVDFEATCPALRGRCYWRTSGISQILQGFYLVNIQKAIENGPVEIVDLPINSMVMFHGYVTVYRRASICSLCLFMVVPTYFNLFQPFGTA